MQYNVAQLLKHGTGERREYPIDGDVHRVDETKRPIPVTGQVELIRTHDGILTRVQADLTTTEECSRCLREIRVPLHLRFEEEFFPTIDVITGAPLPPPREPDAFRIDHNHVLDLEPAIREYAVVARPMQPLCQDACRGLCATCGADLNEGECGCAAAAVDPRWTALERLKVER